MADKDRTKILDAARGALEIANHGVKLLSDKDEAKVTAGLSNVAVFGRIVTSRLQLLRSADHHFDEWYAPHQEEMAADPLCRYFYELRTAIEHQIPPEPTHYGTHIEYLDMRDLTPLWAAAPPGARSLFIGDSQGRNGFEVELPDGTVETYYIELPPGVHVRDLKTLPNAPTAHLGRPIVDASLETLASLYLAYLSNLVQSAASEFAA